MNEAKLKKFLSMFNEFDIDELEVEESFWGGTRVRAVRRGSLERTVVTHDVVGNSEIVKEPTSAEGRKGEREVVDDKHILRSPMVGTFYRAASPESEVFVVEGVDVQEGQTLCIIEAMKIMNEIPCEVSGVIEEILVQNGDPVEYNQPLFKIRST